MSETEQSEEIVLACPICDGRHTYPLEVERSFVMYAMAPTEIPPDKERNFIRIFVCPKTGETFQGSIKLTENAFEKIIDLRVGPAKQSG